MTAFAVGRRVGELQVQAGDNPGLTYVGRLLHWIPTDAVGAYTAAVTVLVDDETDKSNPWLVVAGGAVALILLLLGAGSKGSTYDWNYKLIPRAAIVVLAFGIWSVTVPDSGWQEVEWVDKHPGWTVAIAALLGLVLAAFADRIKPWLDTPPD